ncbi:L-cysteine:1D-myo-inositol 2-amino-2-deoxy-alpha-D-glucopyranoside ligase [Oligella ureolytica]
MLIYNSLTRRKDELKPVEPNKIRMYVCGMTVYDFCHLGHARMLVSFDVVQRWLRCLGYEVTYVRNVTDIDDKIIRRAVATQKRLHQVTSFFTDAMHADERVSMYSLLTMSHELPVMYRAWLKLFKLSKKMA